MTQKRNPHRSSRSNVSSSGGPASSALPVRKKATKKPLKKAGSSARPGRKATAKPLVSGTSSPTELPSASSLLNNSQQTTDEWYKSPRTKKGYSNYVKSGKAWIIEWTSEGRLDDEISADAFDIITSEIPLALRALTVFKWFAGDFWKYNSHTGNWEGNPVFESGFKTYYESLKNRHNRTSTATQALPMLPADLKMIMEYLDSPEAIEYFTVTQRLYFKVFVSTAFTLWMRNDELINLQFKDIKLNLRSATGIPYHEFALIFRKTNKDPTKVQRYMVQIDLAHPEIDCYTHFDAWKKHMEGLLGRPLRGTDFVFPAIASTGQLKIGECTSRSGFESLLDDVVERSGVMKGRNGKFTTHCFRRGGAQYRFLWAERKWSLKAVKRWGGWSSNENVGTLMRYLLHELMAYEEGFSDIMMDDRVCDRHETFMGENDTAPLSKADLVHFEGTILGKIQHLLNVPVLPASHVTTTMSDGSSNHHLLHAHPQPRSPASVDLPLSPSPPLQTLRPSHIPETKSLDDALEYWEHGSPEKGLNVPLKDWSALFKSSEYTSEAVKLSNIRFVCEEFQGRCTGDYNIFETRFPGLRKKFTMLMKAVRAEHKIRGETKSRSSHNK
ncbi:hypothetical protein DFH07DRAFT_766219 [Mycena maculata]|uniref:Tyr recombinase domain-containing protein n=1 Tax=Mycena maculata TaxID=230809 RepID=A0AAD7K6T6_9AGAR|nr:hypothetical protein DFH07DRAFT_766219 [Mycena maculata]